MAAESEGRPLAAMVPAVALGTEIPPEPPDVLTRQLGVAARLLCGATTFFFVAFVFAYFYLRSLDQDHMWRPADVKPDQLWGAVFLACLLASVFSSIGAAALMRRASRRWLWLGLASLALGLAAVAAQCIEYTVQHFGPTNGAYASVFCVWLAFYLIAVLATMVWLEIALASELRARRAPASSEGDLKDPDLLIAPGLSGAAFYWGFLGAIGLLTYVVLYALQ